ncbi:MAG: response regulator, partial [Tissierellia bacterium]|nr:response regulator [Tissierellia bacterium]
MKIFIVDDNVNVVKILEKIINDKELGEVIGKAYNGNDALKEIDLIKPDVVLLDFLMPNKDGISLLKEIKKKHPEILY